MQVFDSYVSESSFDEVYDNDKNVRECWEEVLQDIEDSGLKLLKEKQAEIDWHLEDNGVTYNMYGDYDKPAHRSWSLDPIPFVIQEKEWDDIKKGLKQRAKLFNLILKDLYSEQKLIKENIVPAEVIFGHKGFSTEVFNFGYKEDFNLYFYATDIARGPDGKMWVISDKAQAPSGLGYAIENRLTMNIIAKDLYPKIETKKLSPFLHAFKDLLEDLTGGDISKAALLTPGPHNETYFEHAYLSSYLEINIVQGQDLLSKNGSLWIKSLSGLEKINTLLRRVDDNFSDPLELRNDSRLGVAGLVESMRQDNLNMINPIGSAVLENIGLNPFMKKIAQYFLKEDLILPQIATWWCGQKKELDYVLAHLDTLVIKKIDRAADIKIYFGKNLSQEERNDLIILLQKNPYQYVAQEDVDFSTVPYYGNGKIEPRNAVIRSFCLRKKDNYTVMNGGLVRMAESKDSLLVSSKSGGISKDLWILGKDKLIVNPLNDLSQTPYVETSIDKISTLKAENLFWLGRYLSRSVSTTRLLSHVIKKITNFYRYEVATSKESQVILQNALTHMTMTYPGFMDTGNQNNLDVFPMLEITSVIKDIHRSGSLALTLSMLANANINLKDLLTLESWKLFDRLQKEWNIFANRQGDSTLVVASELDTLLIYLMAYKELVKDSIFKEQGLILYHIGYKIEDGLLLISKAKSMLCLKLDKSVGHDVLEGMLNSIESFNAYRAHYRSSLTLENVVDFLIFNPQFPKSLMYIIDTLLTEFKLLPKAKKTLTTYEETMLDARLLLKSMDVRSLMKIKEEEGVYVELDEMLSQLSDLFLECSNEFSNTYFSHYDE
ncbi:MAG: circularly permuted type 2 ATP-grasp protein [Sulfurovum sp.]|nr:circularly permuted type 2 ATP-grasp protein [Sulfurovum sp.]